MATVQFSSGLRRHTYGVGRVEVRAKTVRALIAELEQRFPALRGERLTEFLQLRRGGEASGPCVRECAELLFVKDPDRELRERFLLGLPLGEPIRPHSRGVTFLSWR